MRPVTEPLKNTPLLAEADVIQQHLSQSTAALLLQLLDASSAI
jgi:hypothetical protein